MARPGRRAVAGASARAAAEPALEAASDATLVLRVRRLVALGLLVTLAVGWRAFLEPAWPFSAMPALGLTCPAGILSALVAAAMLLLAWVVLRPSAARAAQAAALLLAARALPDLMAWQPYVLQLGMLLVAATIVPERPRGEGPRAALDTCRLVLAGTYAWSGFSKLDFTFLAGGGAEAIFPVLEIVPSDVRPFVAAAAPLGELAAGIGLLVGATRRASTVALVAMHAAILLAVGPWGLDRNVVVWPWNVASAALVLALGDLRSRSAARSVRADRSVVRIAVLALFLVLPGLSYVGAWPTCLAFRLYSYRIPDGSLWVTEEGRRALPPEAAALVRAAPRGRHVGFVRLQEWADARLGVMLPVSDRAYEAVYFRACARAESPDDLLLVVEEPDWRTGRARARQVACDGTVTPIPPAP